MMKLLLPLIVAVIAGSAACGKERIEVSETAAADYNDTELRAAVEKFVASGRTPDAYGELAQAVLALRPGMDRSVADDAELKLIVLALAPVQSMTGKPGTTQIEELALTVWPTLLAPPLEADAVLLKRDPRAAELMPKPGEDARAYLMRLCGGPLAGDCKQVVPEHQGTVIGALATRRATERARNAIAGCMMCPNEPGWAEAVRAWEALDRMANSSIHDVERRAAPDNWPTAGNSGQADPGLPEAELNATGEIVIAGQRYGAGERIDALRDLRGSSTTIALHLRPEMSLAQVKGIVADAKKSGAAKVAVVARAPQYPWDRRVYWLADAGSTRAGLRPTDSLQLLLHTIDHIATPGAVARVD